MANERSCRCSNMAIHMLWHQAKTFEDPTVIKLQVKGEWHGLKGKLRKRQLGIAQLINTHQAPSYAELRHDFYCACDRCRLPRLQWHRLTGQRGQTHGASGFRFTWDNGANNRS